MAELPGIFHRAFSEVFPAVAGQGIPIVSAPFGYYPTMPGETVSVEAGVVVARPIEAVGEVAPGTLPSGRAAHVVHVGSYDSMEQTYAEIQRWAAETGEDLGPGAWEMYLSDPQAEPDPSTWRTEIFWPLAT